MGHCHFSEVMNQTPVECGMLRDIVDFISNEVTFFSEKVTSPRGDGFTQDIPQTFYCCVHLFL